MNTIQAIMVAAALVLAGTARQPLAEPLASATGPAAASAPDSLAPPAATESVQKTRYGLESTPSALALAQLRASIGRRALRVSVDQDVYELTRARFDSSGVSFTPGAEEGMPLWPGEDARPIASPIAWERIDCIRARRPYATAGAIAGAALAVAPIIVAMRHQDRYSVEADIGWAIVTPLVAAFGAVVGGNAGAVGTWPIEWQRAPARRRGH